MKKKPLKDINHFEKQKYEIISFSLLVAEHEGQSQENEGETIDIDGSEGIVNFNGDGKNNNKERVQYKL